MDVICNSFVVRWYPCFFILWLHVASVANDDALFPDSSGIVVVTTTLIYSEAFGLVGEM